MLCEKVEKIPKTRPVIPTTIVSISMAAKILCSILLILGLVK